MDIPTPRHREKTGSLFCVGAKASYFSHLLSYFAMIFLFNITFFEQTSCFVAWSLSVQRSSSWVHDGDHLHNNCIHLHLYSLFYVFSHQPISRGLFLSWTLSNRCPRTSGGGILEVAKTMRYHAVGCEAAAMLKPWGTRRAESRTPVQRHRLRSRYGKMPWSRLSSGQGSCWTPTGMTQNPYLPVSETTFKCLSEFRQYHHWPLILLLFCAFFGCFFLK